MRSRSLFVYTLMKRRNQEFLAKFPTRPSSPPSTLEVFPGSCTSLARAHCLHTITTIFEALYLDRNTSTRAVQWLILIAVASSIGMFNQVSSKSRRRLIALPVLDLSCSGTVSTSGSITTTTGSWGCFCLGGLPLGLLFEAEESV